MHLLLIKALMFCWTGTQSQYLCLCWP